MQPVVEPTAKARAPKAIQRGNSFSSVEGLAALAVAASFKVFMAVAPFRRARLRADLLL